MLHKPAVVAGSALCLRTGRRAVRSSAAQMHSRRCQDVAFEASDLGSGFGAGVEGEGGASGAGPASRLEGHGFVVSMPSESETAV